MHIFNQWSTTYKKNSDNLVLGRASNNILIDTSRPSPRQSEKIPKTHLFGDFLVPAFRPGHQPEVWWIPTNSASKSRKVPRSDLLVKIDIAIADFSNSGFRPNFALRQCTGTYINVPWWYCPTTSNSNTRICIKNAHLPKTYESAQIPSNLSLNPSWRLYPSWFHHQGSLWGPVGALGWAIWQKIQWEMIGKHSNCQHQRSDSSKAYRRNRWPCYRQDIFAST